MRPEVWVGLGMMIAILLVLWIRHELRNPYEPGETMRPPPPDAHRAENQVERRRILRRVK